MASAATGSVMVLAKIALDDTWVDAGDTELVVLLAKAIRDRTHSVFCCTVNRRCWYDLKRTDRRDIDDVARAALVHVWKHRSDAIEDALDVDVDHLLPFVDLERCHG